MSVLDERTMTMASAKRAQLAEMLCDRFVDHCRDQVLLAGVYGSTARGDATAWSDLEMLFVVKNTCTASGQHLIVQGIPVGYRVYRQEALESLLVQPGLKWPFIMGVLDVLRVLYGDTAQAQRWISLGSSVPVARFREALGQALPGLVFESHGRLHSCMHRHELADFTPALLEVLFEMRTALCLINQRWVTHDYYQGLADTFRFSRLPQGYQEDVEALYRSHDPQAALPVADRLVQSYRQLLSEEGLAVKDYRSVEEIPV